MSELINETGSVYTVVFNKSDGISDEVNILYSYNCVNMYTFITSLLDESFSLLSILIMSLNHWPLMQMEILCSERYECHILV